VGGFRNRSGEARTIQRLHIISARPSKQPLMQGTFLKVYMERQRAEESHRDGCQNALS
jgi:hypothetical protein